MKTLTIALVAASIAATPLAAFAQSASTASKDAAATTTAALAPANSTPASKTWKVGQRIPGTYLATNRYKADVEALNLPKAPLQHTWLHVGDNAYLISDKTTLIKQITGVAPKS
jgi:Ni/Co efflux regulator RcnB